MRHSILLVFFLTNVVVAQKLRLPKKPYVIVIGKDTLVTRSVIVAAPNDYENYTLESKGAYANVDRLRVWTYLLENDEYSINFPPRIDTVIVGPPCCQPPPPSLELPSNNGVELIVGGQSIIIDTTGYADIHELVANSKLFRVDTTDHIDINKFVGTIAAKEKSKFLETEIQVYYGSKRLQVRELRVLLVWPDGKTFEDSYCENGTRIGNCMSISDALKTIPLNGYIVISRIWFYNEWNEPHGISDKIGWKIE